LAFEVEFCGPAPGYAILEFAEGSDEQLLTGAGDSDGGPGSDFQITGFFEMMIVGDKIGGFLRHNDGCDSK